MYLKSEKKAKSEPAAGLSAVQLKRAGKSDKKIKDNRNEQVLTNQRKKPLSNVGLNSNSVIQGADIVQFTLEIAQHNWGIIASYGSGGNEVMRAFLKAGYTMEDMETKIPEALMILGLDKSKLAHGKGGKGSKRKGGKGGQKKGGKKFKKKGGGGADVKINESKEALIKWAEENPKG